MTESVSADRMRGAIPACGKRVASGDAMLVGADGGGSVDGAGAGGERSGVLVSRECPESNIRNTTSTPVSMRGELGIDAGGDHTTITTATANAMWSRTEAVIARRRQVRVVRTPGIM
jgi:hypothetical protein